jgi:hypothetical protein
LKCTIEVNNEETRSNARTEVEMYFELLKQSKEIDDYKVVCDATNNPPMTTELALTTWIKPAKTIQYIALDWRVK